MRPIFYQIISSLIPSVLKSSKDLKDMILNLKENETSRKCKIRNEKISIKCKSFFFSRSKAKKEYRYIFDSLQRIGRYQFRSLNIIQI